MSLEDIARAILAWQGMKNRVHLMALSTTRNFDAESRKHILRVTIVFKCDTARDCHKIEDALKYVSDNFEELKDKPSLSTLKALLPK